MFTTRASKAVSFGLLVAIAAIAPSQDEKAQRYLFRSLAGDYRTNIVAVLKQRIANENGSKLVKIQRSMDGKTKESVLSPLHLQGEFLDDGKELKFYSPDDRLLIVQPNNPAAQDYKFRLPLIQKNYNIRLEPGRKVLGRNCVVVTAESKYPKVSDIRYSFDEKTGFPLSKEIIHSDKTVDLDYEVSDIKFPGKLDPSIFRIEPVVGVEVVNYAEQCVNRPSEAAQALGFVPLIPTRFPYGFQIQRMTISDKNKVKMLCLKLTDGLQRITIYEWVPAPGETITTGEDREIKLHNGLKIVAVADIDSGIRDSVLHTFIVRAEGDGPALITRIGI